jgi:hypothetical protein
MRCGCRDRRKDAELDPFIRNHWMRLWNPDESVVEVCRSVRSPPRLVLTREHRRRLCGKVVGFKTAYTSRSKFTVFTVRVWAGDYEWLVERRYSDFERLHDGLMELFPSGMWGTRSRHSGV